MIKTLRKSALSAGLTLVAAAVVAFGVAGPAAAVTGTRVSGVDISQACLEQNGPGFSVVHGSDVMSWRCRYSGGWNYVDLGVNLNTWCATHKAGSHADYTNFNDPYSWGCYR